MVVKLDLISDYIVVSHVCTTFHEVVVELNNILHNLVSLFCTTFCDIVVELNNRFDYSVSLSCTTFCDMVVEINHIFDYIVSLSCSTFCSVTRLLNLTIYLIILFHLPTHFLWPGCWTLPNIWFVCTTFCDKIVKLNHIFDNIV